MRQLTLGVQFKERATFASFLTARNQSSWWRTCMHVAASAPRGSHLDRRPAHGGQVAPAAGGVRGQLAPENAPPIFRSRPLLPFGPAALDGAEQLDVACYDDVQVIAGLEDWEQRLFSLWQRALERNSTLLFAARENPAHVDFGSPDLKSRLASSAVFAVRELNDDEQIEALKLRAQAAWTRAAAGDGALPAAAFSARHAHVVRDPRYAR